MRTMEMSYMQSFIAVNAELKRQTLKWGIQTHSQAAWALILAEEFGEVAKEANECHFRCRSTAGLREELIQTAAVCLAWLENLDHNEGKNSDE